MEKENSGKTSENKNKKKHLNKNAGYLLLAVIFLVATCAVAVILNVLKLSEIPSTFIGAALGAAITAALTLVLLSGQTQAEEVKERNVKVFEKKSEIFQRYIKEVWKVWADRTVTAEEYQNLVAEYYSELMLYLSDPDDVKKIGTHLANIGKHIDQLTNGTEYVELRGNVIGIINTLSDDINLGGQIDLKTVAELDEKMFLPLFKSELLRAFNQELFVEPHGDVLKAGTWIIENGKVAMEFLFQKYPRISIKCMANGDSFQAILNVPTGREYHSFNDYRLFVPPHRESVKVNFKMRLGNLLWHNILADGQIPYEGIEDDKETIKPFDLSKGMEDEGVKALRSGDYQKTINLLARRMTHFFYQRKYFVAGEELTMPEAVEKLMESGK